MRRALLLVFLAFFLQVVTLLGAFQSQVGLIQDEMFVVECSSRMMRGEYPYRDYVTRFMPGANWVLNGFFRTFGENLVAVRLYFILMAGFLAASLQWFSMKLLPRGWSELPTALFLCVGIQAWPMLSFHWDATIFSLLALATLAPARTPKRLLGAGVLCGITVLFLQTKGLATCLGGGLMLLLEPIPFRARLRHLGLLIAGAAAPGILFVLWLALNGLTEAFFFRAVGFNASRYLVLHRAPLDFSPLGQDLAIVAQGVQNLGQPTWDAWADWFWKASSFAAVDFLKFGGYYPVLLGGAVLAGIQARRKPWSPQVTAFVGLILVLLLASLFDFGRPNRYRLHFQAPLWDAVLAYLLYTLSGHARKTARTLTVLILVPFVAQGLAAILSWGEYKYPVDFPRGRLYFGDARLAGHLQQVHALLESSVPPQAPLFAYPQQNVLPWLEAHPNPTRFPETIPVLYAREDFEEVARELTALKVPYILYTPLDPHLNGDYPGVKPEDFEREQNWARDLLAQEYEKVFETPDSILYRRK